MEEILKKQQELLGMDSSKYSVEFLKNGTDKQEHQGEVQNLRKWLLLLFETPTVGWTPVQTGWIRFRQGWLPICSFIFLCDAMWIKMILVVLSVFMTWVRKRRLIHHRLCGKMQKLLCTYFPEYIFIVAKLCRSGNLFYFPKCALSKSSFEDYET